MKIGLRGLAMVSLVIGFISSFMHFDRPYAFLFIGASMMIAFLDDMIETLFYKAKGRSVSASNRCFFGIISLLLGTIALVIFFTVGILNQLHIFGIFLAVAVVSLIYLGIRFHFLEGIVKVEVDARFFKPLLKQNKKLVNIVDQATQKIEELRKERDKYKKVSALYYKHCRKKRSSK